MYDPKRNKKQRGRSSFQVLDLYSSYFTEYLKSPTMKQRTKDYIERKKARSIMLHPDEIDLKNLLIAEHDSSRNLVVKKDIMKMLAQMETTETPAEA
jgi:hypothetical protein